MSAILEQLQREIAELKARLDAQERGAGAASTRPGYLLSDADSAKAAATRARNAELAARGGARPLGGGTGGDLNAPGRISGGVRIDTLSETREESERGTGSGPEAEADQHPFQPTPTPGVAAVTFEPGIIISDGASISPTVGGGSPMATVPRPQLTITTTGTIYLEATVDGAGAATAIDTKNAATTPASTTTLKRLTIATVTLAGAAVTVTSRPIRESRTLYLCNGSPIWEA